MNSNIFISIIIPTYNRSEYLLKLLLKLRSNFLNFKNFEVIICDSNSKDNTKSKIDAFKIENHFLNIRYLNIKKNIHSVKRNTGIKFSKGKYIIFLDDDCFPESTFVKDYYHLLSKNDKVIYCGSVKYSQNILKDNFIRYRQSKHFIYKKNTSDVPQILSAAKIVTMNMAVKKYILLKNKIFFNEDFNRYGFEDYEFGFRLIDNGFKIIQSSPLVYHLDKRNFELYLKKIRFLGFESMQYLINLNLEAAKKNNFYKLEKFLLIRFFLNFIVFKNLLLLIKKICIFLNKTFIYVPFIYKIALASAYLEGCFYRNRYNNWNNINEKWYK